MSFRAPTMLGCGISGARNHLFRARSRSTDSVANSGSAKRPVSRRIALPSFTPGSHRERETTYLGGGPTRGTRAHRAAAGRPALPAARERSIGPAGALSGGKFGLAGGLGRSAQEDREHGGPHLVVGHGGRQVDDGPAVEREEVVTPAVGVELPPRPAAQGPPVALDCYEQRRPGDVEDEQVAAEDQLVLRLEGAERRQRRTDAALQATLGWWIVAPFVEEHAEHPHPRLGPRPGKRPLQIVDCPQPPGEAVVDHASGKKAAETGGQVDDGPRRTGDRNPPDAHDVLGGQRSDAVGYGPPDPWVPEPGDTDLDPVTRDHVRNAVDLGGGRV